MTIPHSTLTDRIAPPLAGQRIEVRWSAVVADRRREGGAAPQRLTFVVTLEPVDDHHALLEAWLDAPAGPRVTFRRQPVACAVAHDGRLLHADAHLDGRRLLGVSLAPRDPGGGAILYAQSPLLAEAGLPPGGYDPPTARLLAAEQDAASA